MMTSKQELEQKILPAIPLLKKYWDLLLEWQKSVNLISPNTIEEGWNRHILDSAQLYFLIENQQDSLMDFGSGGGLPGIVLAILNQVLNGPLKHIVLIESDLKKTLFLKECVRCLGLQAEIKRARVEAVQMRPRVITARAVAPLDKLLWLVRENVSRETILIVPKGKSVDEEIKNLHLKCEIEKISNVVNSDGCILKIKGVQYD